MKGFITKALRALAWMGGLMFTGCGPHYQDVVDTCYPDRYSNMARKEVEQALAPQMQNGHVLDQTVWNSHFEPGTAKLTRGGQDHLAYIIRRRPNPDTTLFLQSTQDVPYDPAAPQQFAEKRNQIDGERVEAIQKFMNAKSSGRNLTFNVVLHDPATADMPAVMQNQAIRLRYLGPLQGVMPASIVGTGAAPGTVNTGSWQ